MNSMLQCLCSAPPLLRYFGSGRHRSELNPSSPTKGQVAAAFAELLNAVRTGADHTVERPSSVKRLVAQTAPQFAGYGQHDAQEFLRYLLSALHDDLNRIRKPPPYEEIKDGDTDSDETRSRRWWKNYTDRNDSALSHSFCGQLKSAVVCLTCNNLSTVYDPFWDISLPIAKSSSNNSSAFTTGFGRTAHVSGSSSSSLSQTQPSRSTCSLMDCFEAFTSVERLEGNEKYYCRKCKDHRTSTKTLSLFKLPQVLVVHLKRFSYGHSSHSRSKIGAHVDIPRELDLSQYAPPLAPPSRGRPAEPKPHYRLFAVSNHSGGTGGGHYTAHCNVSADLNAGQWYTFNDSQVYSVPHSNLSGPSAYVLFYIRERPSSAKL